MIDRARFCGALLAAFLASLTAARALAEELRILELRHRPAEEILPVIRPLLGRGDVASASGFKLIVRAADPTSLREIERVVRALDVPRTALTLLVRYATVSDSTDRHYGVSGEATLGGDRNRVVISGGGSAPPPGGLEVEHKGIRLHGVETTSTASRETVQRLRVMDGQRAYIQVGQSIPHVQQVLVLAGRQALLAQGVVLQQASTGFEVLPRVRGDEVILEITPRLGSVEDPALGLVRLTELATTVSVRRGEWVDLGSLGGTGEAVRHAILESGVTRAGERQTILIKVE
jgi:type II secretory pathway component GspD/PulD (secretin)